VGGLLSLSPVEAREMAKILKSLWGGAITYEDDDIPFDVRQFNDFGKSAILWLEQSHALHWAAVALKDGAKSRTSTVRAATDHVIAIMLGGYAAETLLKMVIITDHCDARGFARDARHAREFLPTTHDLIKLAAMAKLRINARDRRTLGDLTKYILWAGRYPIPLSAAGYDGPKLFDGVGAERAKRHQAEWKEYDTLIQKLHRLAVRKVFKDQAVSE
jgi:hypothetical protein